MEYWGPKTCFFTATSSVCTVYALCGWPKALWETEEISLQVYIHSKTSVILSLRRLIPFVKCRITMMRKKLA